ncbi:MAG TPA: HEAT repeat domain-containing protein [Gemmataceae bacterium]|nr:HEAT repeat domain-containing protein [Gemmataceae bacterium]
MLASDRSSRHHLGLSGWLFSVALLLTPTAVLGYLALRLDSQDLLVGAGVQALFVLIFFRAHPVWRPPVSVSVVAVYLIALAWAWVPTRGTTDWQVHFAQGIIILFAVVLLIGHDLTRTGAEPLRRANTWTRRLTSRRHWPIQLADCRILPEVQRLRNSIRDQPGPALALLSDPRAEVQVAALGALEYRTKWRPGEAELVLKMARKSQVPGVRAAAAYALAGTDTLELVSGLAEFLRDPAPEVRAAAAEAVMWDADRRWVLAREGVRDALSDPKFAEDGPLFPGTTTFPAAAVADLTTWAGEHPPLAQRAILTLVEHLHRGLLDAERPDLASELAAQMLDPNSPPALRVELAALLRDHHMLSADLLDRLTNLDQPGPIRLFAAEVMLMANPHDPDGLDVLRGLARQPNRELAVQIAGILQNILGLELGLPPGELPAHTSKVAAEVARRVLLWANGATPDMIRPPAGPMGGLKPGSRPPFAGLQRTNFVPPDPPRKRGSSSGVL